MLRHRGSLGFLSSFHSSYAPCLAFSVYQPKRCCAGPVRTSNALGGKARRLTKISGYPVQTRSESQPAVSYTRYIVNHGFVSQVSSLKAAIATNDVEAAFAALYEIISASPLNVSFLTAGLQLQPWIQSLVDRTPGMSLRILQQNGAFVQLPTELLKIWSVKLKLLASNSWARQRHTLCKLIQNHWSDLIYKHSSFG